MVCTLHKILFFLWRNSPPVGRGLLSVEALRSLRHTALARTRLDKLSARRRDLYLTTRNTNKKQTSMPPTGFVPAIPTSGRQQTHALDRASTETGSRILLGWSNQRGWDEWDIVRMGKNTNELRGFVGNPLERTRQCGIIIKTVLTEMQWEMGLNLCGPE